MAGYAACKCCSRTARSTYTALEMQSNHLMLGPAPLGGLISLAILAPDILWLFFPPRRVPAGIESGKVVAKVELLGRIATFTLPFCYPLVVRTELEWGAFGVGVIALAFYYAGWVRYFAQGRDFHLLYSSLAGIPVAMAVAPITSFAASAVMLHSPWLGLATAIFGAAHILSSTAIARHLAADETMKGRVCVVTGANSGIGRATVFGLVAHGAIVVMVCRDRERGEHVGAAVVERTGNADVHLLLADLSEQAAIRRLAQDIALRFDRVHVLVNCAGATFFERRDSVDGIEMGFAVNVVAPFLLTNLLVPTLIASAPARVVTVTGRYRQSVEPGDEGAATKSAFDPMLAAARAGVAKVLFTLELARRLAGTGVTANCIYPGPVRTALQRKLPWYYRLIVYPMLPFSRGRRAARAPSSASRRRWSSKG